MQNSSLTIRDEIQMPFFMVPGINLSIPIKFEWEEAKKNILHLQKVGEHVKTIEALCVGATLLLAKKELPPGQYGKFLEEVSIKERTARYYARLAEFFQGMYDRVAHLPISKLDALAMSGKEAAQALIEDGQAQIGGKTLSFEELRGLTSKELVEKARAAKKQETVARTCYEEAEKTHAAEVQEFQAELEKKETIIRELMDKGNDARVANLRGLIEQRDQAIRDCEEEIAALKAKEVRVWEEEKIIESLDEKEKILASILYKLNTLHFEEHRGNAVLIAKLRGFTETIGYAVDLMRNKLNAISDLEG